MAIPDAPLLAAWQSFVGDPPTPFTIPGHKQAAGRLWPELGAVLAGDVPLYGGLDTVKLSAGVLADAEARAARLWGADWCRFSTGGSTHANQVLALAVGQPGDTVLVSRSAHRSTLSGLVLAGLTPVWLGTTVDSRTGVPAGVEPAVLAEAIAAHPAARAVLLVEPSYLGTVSELPTLVGLAHAAGLPVLVDQAWGAHFGFHPDLPDHALTAGADALVLSAHKTLPAYSQASVVLARTDRLNADRLERAFELGNTTSPAGSILASIDGARALLAGRGPELLGWLIEAVARVRRELRGVPGLVVPGPEDYPAGRFDPTKLVLLLTDAGVMASGIAVEQELLAAGLPVEMADRDTVVPIVTLADTDETLGRLVRALRTAITTAPEPAAVRTAANGPVSTGTAARGPESAGTVPRGPVSTGTAASDRTAPGRAVAAYWGPPAVAAMTPREAFFAPHRTVPTAEAIGSVSAELVAPYPPGIPVLVPGEIITAGTIAALREAYGQGTRIAYAADPTLGTIQIVS